MCSSDLSEPDVWRVLADDDGTVVTTSLAAPWDSFTLDGVPVSGFSGIGGSGYGVARVEIPGGSHEIASTDEFGITCYGYGNYTSYMYPGGLDVDQINIY